MVIMRKKQYNELIDRIKQLEIFVLNTETRLIRLEAIGGMDKKKNEPRSKQVLHEYLHGKDATK